MNRVSFRGWVTTIAVAVCWVFANPARAGYVAYWRFGEGTANTAASGPDSVLDSSGHGLNGTPFNGPVYRSNVPVNSIPQTGATNALSLEFNADTTGRAGNQRIFVPDDPLLQLVRDRARTLAGQGEWDRAEALYRRAAPLAASLVQTSQDPGWEFESVAVQLELGNFLRRLGRHRAAADVFAIAVSRRHAVSAVDLNNVAWFFATCPDPAARNPGLALELARVALKPGWIRPAQKGPFWNTFGVALYRAGDWRAAVEALSTSAALQKGGDATDFFFLAMAHWQLGERDVARGGTGRRSGGSRPTSRPRN